MKLVVGLGNPGEKYAHTRHNVGWRVIDLLASRLAVELREEKKCNAAVVRAGDVMLCKPLTFMNNSGEAVQRVSKYYDIANEDIIVIYDDIAIPFGVIRLRSFGSSGGHNGMQSIIQMMGGQNLPRVRIGILGVRPMADLAQYVLRPFSGEEETVLPELIAAATDAVARVVKSGLQAQNHADIVVLKKKAETIEHLPK